MDDQEGITMLLSLGFDEEVAKLAFELAGGDVEAAANL